MIRTLFFSKKLFMTKKYMKKDLQILFFVQFFFIILFAVKKIAFYFNYICTIFYINKLKIKKLIFT